MTHIFDDVLQVVSINNKRLYTFFEKEESKKKDVKSIDINIKTPNDKEKAPEPELEPQMADQDPNNIMQDPNAMMQDPNEVLDPETLGKVFILKKMYVRLIALDDRLQHIIDRKYDRIKKDTIEMIELYHNIILKFELFQDKIDDIIKITQDFLSNACDKLDSME